MLCQTYRFLERLFHYTTLTTAQRPRRNRRSDIQDVQKKEVEEDVEIEVRPLVNFKSKEAGLDYWMDEDELKKSIKLEKAIKNRKVRIDPNLIELYGIFDHSTSILFHEKLSK